MKEKYDQYQNMKTDDAIKTQEGVSKRTALLIAVGAGFFLLMWIIFLALYASTASSKSTLQTENDRLSEENTKQATQITGLNTQVKALSEANETQTKQIIVLKENVTTLNNSVDKLTKQTTAQAAEISSLKTTNLILWIGGGTSLALAAGGGGFGYYELQRANGLETQLATTTERYNHFRHYFDESYLWTVEDYMVYYVYDEITWSTLYNSTVKWDFNVLVANISGKFNTSTLIMTEQDYVIAAVLPGAWKNDGSYTSDKLAFTMSVNRVWELNLQESTPPSYDYAARVNNTTIEFGQGDIIVKSDGTGSAKGNVTYKNTYSTPINPDTFYANQPTFKVKWLRVLQWTNRRIQTYDANLPFKRSRIPYPT